MTQDIFESDPQFSSRVADRPESGCWPCAGYVHHTGYVNLERAGATVGAHRHAFWLVHGFLPACTNLRHELVVDHLCHNRVCVNPAHLALLPRSANAAIRAFSTKSDRPPARRRAPGSAFCLNGHAIIGHNAMSNGATGTRCRACWNARRKELRSQRRGG